MDSTTTYGARAWVGAGRQYQRRGRFGQRFWRQLIPAIERRARAFADRGRLQEEPTSRDSGWRDGVQSWRASTGNPGMNPVADVVDHCREVGEYADWKKASAPRLVRWPTTPSATTERKHRRGKTVVGAGCDAPDRGQFSGDMEATTRTRHRGGVNKHWTVRNDRSDPRLITRPAAITTRWRAAKLTRAERGLRSVVGGVRARYNLN